MNSAFQFTDNDFELEIQSYYFFIENGDLEKIKRLCKFWLFAAAAMDFFIISLIASSRAFFPSFVEGKTTSIWIALRFAIAFPLQFVIILLYYFCKLGNSAGSKKNKKYAKFT